jgi:hypothetical protein
MNRRIAPWTFGQSNDLKLLGLLLLVCASLIAIAAALPRALGLEAAGAPLLLGDISEAHIVEIRDAGGASVLMGEFRVRVDALGNTERDAALADRTDRRVIGEVELEIPAPGRLDRRPELEVDIMGLPPRQQFAVVIDDRVVGTFVTDDRGSVDLEIQEGEIVGGRSRE